MSSASVRAAFRTQVAGLLSGSGFDFIESVNRAESVTELPQRWYTLDFAVAGDQRMSLGVPTLFREQGTVTVVIFTEQNIEDAAATNAAEVVRAALANWNALDGHLHVQQAAPPADLAGGDFRGSFYGVMVDIGYTFDRIVS